MLRLSSCSVFLNGTVEPALGHSKGDTGNIHKREPIAKRLGAIRRIGVTTGSKAGRGRVGKRGRVEKCCLGHHKEGLLVTQTWDLGHFSDIEQVS